LLQRVCLDRGCGYGAPTLRSANGAWSWYLGPDVGVGALHGAPVSFTFSADLCEAGDMSTYGGAIPWCQECQPGKFSPERGAFACSPCPRGTFAAAGASSCTACPPGESTTHVGSMDEEACQGACPVGTFGTDAGLAPCFPCPRGTFASAGGLTACRHAPPALPRCNPTQHRRSERLSVRRRARPATSEPLGLLLVRHARPAVSRQQRAWKSASRAGWDSFPSQASPDVRNAQARASWRC